MTKSYDSSALAHPPEFEFNETRREIVRNFKGSVDELVSRLEYCGYPKYFIKQHVEYFHEYHETKRPTLTQRFVEAVEEDGSCRPIEEKKPTSSSAAPPYAGSAPLELSSDEDSKDVSMAELAAAMVGHKMGYYDASDAPTYNPYKGCAFPHNPHLPHPKAVAAAPPLKVFVAAPGAGSEATQLVRGKSMFDLTSPLAAYEHDNAFSMGVSMPARTEYTDTDLYENRSYFESLEVAGDSKAADDVS